MTNNTLSAKILTFADDSFILGHRNSEWAGHAPILEEDIAFSNLALDELGHAQLWYQLYGELTGTEPDRIIFFREPSAWRNTQFVELPKGDWAFSMLRQYLFDAYENVLLPHLVNSSDARIAEIATKIRSEEIYHLRHTLNWTKRLGLGSDESQARMQRALDELWAYALQLFVPLDNEQALVAEKIAPDLTLVRDEWQAQTSAHLSGSGLTMPESASSAGSSREQHTDFLSEVLKDMQEVARLENFGVEW
jgi:ring-1,2-phenylacetyl-CoA epoxidase subunit PaaC